MTRVIRAWWPILFLFPIMLIVLRPKEVRVIAQKATLPLDSFTSLNMLRELPGDEIPVTPPTALGFLTRAELTKMRIEAASRFAQLYDGNYAPRPLVFRGLVDSAPWVGMAGRALWGNGPRIIEGVSIDSQALLNPLMLLQASLYCEPCLEELKKRPELRNRDDFPGFVPAVTEISLDPGAKEWGSVTPVTPTVEWVRRVTGSDFPLDNYEVWFSAMNARDFGYDWLEITELEGVRFLATPLLLPWGFTNKSEFAHSAFCLYGTGCNYVKASPHDDKYREGTRLVLTKLPATVTFRLRQSQSSGLEDSVLWKAKFE